MSTENQASQSALHKEFHKLIEHPVSNYQRLLELAQSIENPHLLSGAPMSPISSCVSNTTEDASISSEKLEFLKIMLPKTQPLVQESASLSVPWLEYLSTVRSSSAQKILNSGVIDDLPMKDHLQPYIEKIDRGEVLEQAFLISLEQKVKYPDLEMHLDRLRGETELLDYIFSWSEEIKGEILGQLVTNGWDVHARHANELMSADDDAQAFLENENVLDYEASFIELTPLAFTVIHGDAPMFLKLIELGASTEGGQIFFGDEIAWPLAKVFEYAKVNQVTGADMVEEVYRSHLAAGAAQQAMQDILSTTPRP